MFMKEFTDIKLPLLILSILGFVFINIPFLYIAVNEREVYLEAMNNSLALVFMAEAIVLMILGALLICRLGIQKPGWIWFILLSIIGSLAFSVPFFLYLHSRGLQRGSQQR